MREHIYILIKNDIENKIQEGIYNPGDKIPSERELCDIYNTSRMTVRQAVNELVKIGLIKREKGRGSFVSSPQFLQKNIRSFTHTLREQGYEPSTELIEFSTVHNIKYISQELGEDKEQKLYKIKRLRLANNIPIALETIYIPTYRCIDLKDFELKNSFYEMLETRYGFSVEKISCNMEAVISSRQLMRCFNIQNPMTLLKVESVNYTTKGEKLFYEESYYYSKVYKYHVDIYRR